MSEQALQHHTRALGSVEYSRCMAGIVWREALRFVQQRGRFIAALVRPLVWLFIFAAGFRSVLGVSIIPPYSTYVPYEVYITPGLIGMIQLFNGMQSSLSMVYDREVGTMRSLLVSPFPRLVSAFRSSPLAEAPGNRFSVYTNLRHACLKLSGVFCSPKPNTSTPCSLIRAASRVKSLSDDTRQKPSNLPLWSKSIASMTSVMSEAFLPVV